MKTYTIFDILTILGLEENYKGNLRRKFNSYSDGLKYDIQKIIWDSLYDLHKKLSMVKYQQFLEEARLGKRPLLSDLYNQAKAAVWQDFDDILAGRPQELKEIDEIRAKLQTFIGTTTA
jgi:hypothetical protein